ncbi:MAG: ATP synthase F1 subunit delta [Clostridia bacterium]|nr:ATP synthase F1 subunit delta [Clostridia bacterium]MDO5302422.1 ATP synthase F1 subunit delta [Clostridia bacterium]
MELTVTRTYGQALYDAAAELGKVEEIKKETEQIDEIFQKENDFYELLTDPAFSAVRKKEILKSVFEGRISKESLNFLYVLIDQGRLHNYSDILREFIKLKNKAEGYGEGIVYSACPLKVAQIEKLEQEAGDLLDKRIKLTNKVDKSLIGGVKIVAEEKLIDASYKSGLNRLHLDIREK